MRRPFLVSSEILINVLHGTITLRVIKKRVTIYALPLTNPSPQILRAKNPMRVPPIHYRSSKVFPSNFDPPMSLVRESERKKKKKNT